MSKKRRRKYNDTHRIINKIAEKLCSECLIWKSLNEYHKCTGSKDRLQSKCKTCQDKYRQRWYIKTPKHKTAVANQKAKQKLIDAGKKRCSKCKTEYSATLEYFSPDKQHKDKLQSWCRECQKKAGKKFYQDNREKILEYEKNRRGTIRGRLQRVYSNINRRCNKPEYKDYKYYGDRGIRNKFSSSDIFLDYVINVLRVDPRGLEIHRIDNDGHYEPGNIQFLTPNEHRKKHRTID